MTKFRDDKPLSINKHIFCIAPMMDWTDRHERYFLRLITKKALLYTEMVTTGALLYGDFQRFLAYHPEEQPLSLQLGGSEPVELGKAAGLGEQFGFQEINLNVGCPSDRVQRGRFGACLMAEPLLVADCIQAMKEAVAIPVTVKCRIGVDERDSYDDLLDFVEQVRASGCRTFIVHARKAWLKGLSPKENREIPPLDYPRVYQLKYDFPDLEIVLNGGIMDLEDAETHLCRGVDGVMLGRAAYQNPFLLTEVDRRFFAVLGRGLNRREIAEAFAEYAAEQINGGVPLNSMTRHILGLFNGLPGARIWRRHLSENAHKPGAGAEVILDALERQEAQMVKRAA